MKPEEFSEAFGCLGFSYSLCTTVMLAGWKALMMEIIRKEPTEIDGFNQSLVIAPTIGTKEMMNRFFQNSSHVVAEFCRTTDLQVDLVLED